MMRRPIAEPVLRELAERASAAGVSRRAFLGLLGAAGGAAMLSACDNGPGAAARAGSVRWGNWRWYLDLDDDGTYPTLEQFQKESGIPVTYMEDIDDCDQFFASVRGALAAGQDPGYDVVTLTDWMAERWVTQGYTQKMNRAAMPNTSRIMKSLASADYDPDRSHTVPWQAGMSGIAWRQDKVPDGLKNFDDLWRDEFKGRVVVLSEFTSTVALALWADGVDPSGPWGDDQFTAAVDKIAARRAEGYIRGVKGNAIMDDLKKGDAWVAVAYSGDIFQANQETKKNPDDPDLLGFAIPESGGVIWADHFMVPKASAEVANVQKLIDFYYDPAVAAQVAAYVNYITPVDGARDEMAKIDSTLVDNPLVFPDQDTLDRCPLVRGFSLDEYVGYTDRFLAAIKTEGGPGEAPTPSPTASTPTPTPTATKTTTAPRPPAPPKPPPPPDDPTPGDEE